MYAAYIFVCVCVRVCVQINFIYKGEKKCAHAKNKHAYENPKPYIYLHTCIFGVLGFRINTYTCCPQPSLGFRGLESNKHAYKHLCIYVCIHM